jgi:hypothetical protein
MFRVELRDRNFNVLEILDNEFIDLAWSYSRIGGCGEFSFRLPRKLYEEKAVSGDFNIRIYRRNSVTKVYDLWYQGLIETKTPNIRGNSENIEISGHGYQSHLKRIYISQTYTNLEVSQIVAAIVGTYVEPYTNVDYEAAMISTSSFTPDKMEFNTDALSAIQTCADLVGYEWGVDKNRDFYFKDESHSVGFRYPLGGNIKDFQEQQDFSSIVNRVFIQGAQSGGTYYTNTYDDLLSQSKYGLRTKPIQNSSISTNAVGAQFATATFSEYREVVRKASCSLIGINAQIEATTPVPLMMVIDREITWGEKRWGTFLWSGRVERQINRINYSVNNNGALSISLDLGQLRPTIAEELSRIEYSLEQQRSASL